MWSCMGGVMCVRPLYPLRRNMRRKSLCKTNSAMELNLLDGCYAYMPWYENSLNWDLGHVWWAWILKKKKKLSISNLFSVFYNYGFLEKKWILYSILFGRVENYEKNESVKNSSKQTANLIGFFLYKVILSITSFLVFYTVPTYS